MPGYRAMESFQGRLVLNTHLRAKVKLRRQFQLKDRPTVIVDRSKAKLMVIDALPSASWMTAGMTLGQALSYHTNTVVLEADEPCYRRVFH